MECVVAVGVHQIYIGGVRFLFCVLVLRGAGGVHRTTGYGANSQMHYTTLSIPVTKTKYSQDMRVLVERSENNTFNTNISGPMMRVRACECFLALPSLLRAYLY